MQLLGTFLHTRNRCDKAKTLQVDLRGSLICSYGGIFVVLPHNHHLSRIGLSQKVCNVIELQIKHRCDKKAKH